MGTGVLIDTNIVIDLLGGVPQAKLVLSKQRDRAISIITWIEVMAGLREYELALTEQLSDSFPVIPLSAEIATEAVHLRKTMRLKLPDAVTLATAHVEKRVLLTRNTRDFKDGKSVRIPYEL